MHLERLLTVLEVTAVAGRAITVPEIQKALGLPKPTCYRLVQALQDQRLFDVTSDGKFVIGERLIRIALLGKSDIDVRNVSASHLREAAIRFNETMFLGRFRDGKVEIIHVETPDDPSRAYIHPGLGERPMHACSYSKAMAAFAEPEFQEKILQNGLQKYTEFTKTTPDAIRAEFEAIRAQGYADCDQEIDLGIASVAAPVMIGNIGAIFSVGAVGPIRRFDKDRRGKIGTELIGLSEKVGGAIQLCNVT